MTTLDAATWAAAIGTILGLIAAIYSVWNARRVRKSRRPDSLFDETTYVVIVSPEEERRYFLSVPAGVNTEKLLDTIATAIQAVEPGQLSSPMDAQHEDGR